MSNYGEYVVGRRNYGKLTQTAGTVITRLIEPHRDGITRLTGVQVKTLTTAHLLTLMRPCNRVRFTAAAAAGQAVVNISADPGVYPSGVRAAANVIAAGDFVVYEVADGTFVVDTVASVSTLAITLTTNLPTSGVKSGGLLWWYGIVTDVNPNDAQTHPRWNLDASTATYLTRADGLTSIPDHKLLDIGGGKYQPLILHIDNGTAASILESVGVEYVRKVA